jgi:hypothetical protein
VREESLDRLAGDSPDWTDRGTADGNSVQPDSDFGEFLGMYAKLQTATISLITSVHSPLFLSPWNNSAPTGWIFVKFYV